MAIQQASAREHLLSGVPVIERTLEPAGISTAVLEGGDGQPVVLLHGPAANAAHWVRVICDLVDTHRVIAPDLPGHGASAAPDDGSLDDAERVFAWLGELIDSTCAEPPVLIGHALGGAMAARFAAGHGGQLSRLVLVDALGLAAFHPAPEFGRALADYFAQPDGDTHDRLWRECAFDLNGMRRHMGERWRPFKAYNLDRARTPSVMAACSTLMAQFGIAAIPAERLARIDVPVSLVWGRHDRATPLEQAEAVRARHGWPLTVIEDCGDDPPVERPEAFTRALRATLLEPGPLAAKGFGGELVDRGHRRYDELRGVFNGMVDRRPALIARCTGARDVSAAVSFARERGLPVSICGGGHNVTGNAVCDDGVTIDLRPMKGIEIHPEKRTCRAEAGLTWGELDAATQEHGLAVTGGRMSTTGIGGLTVGGGSGWIERKCGYTVDNLLSAEIVTADGRIQTASEGENADLFWATRGGGGNFGVVTSFELQLHPIGPTVLGGMLIYPAAMAAEALAHYRDAMAEAPDEVGSGVALVTAPHADFVPEPVRGQPVVGVIVCYAGPVQQGERALRGLRKFGPPAMDLVQPIPYTALQQLIDADFPAGLRNYWTGDFLTGLSEEAIEVLCRFHLSKPSPRTQILTFPGGGAVARVPEGTMACGHDRRAPFNIHITSLWEDPAEDDANIAWTREFRAAIKPFTTGRVYVNFIGDEGEERVVASFGGPERYERLRKLKEQWDPGNLFRFNQNIRLAGGLSETPVR
jgi:FAD/FMN-containing dehydrogenase/pimeloyl-ACP methyl ester carboxylesterase